jgi:hypothetical protein
MFTIFLFIECMDKIKIFSLMLYDSMCLANTINNGIPQKKCVSSLIMILYR